MSYKLVCEYTSIDRNKWIDFVEEHPNGNIFQTPYMFETYLKIEKEKPLILVVLNENDDIIGLQVSVVKKTFNNFLGYFTSRSIVQGGPLILNENSNVLDFILKKYNNKIKGKAIYSQFRNMWDWGSLKQIFKKNKIDLEDHLDILFDLTKGEELLLKEMKRVRRKGINQSYKKGVITKVIDLNNDDLLVEAYTILENIYERIKLPLPNINFFRNVKKGLNEKVFSLGLYVENELIAVRIVFCYKNLIYDWYAGAKDEFLDFRPNDVLPWEIMKWGIENGYEIFDFGGAGKPDVPYGVRDFKLKFGGSLVNFGRFQKIHSKAIYKLISFALKLYRK